MKTSKDGLCVFDPVKHTYHVGGRRLLGVTTAISQYKNKFDAQAVAAACVARDGGNVDELLAKWKLEGELSCIAGSAVHDVFEKYCLTGKIETIGTYAKELHAVSFIKDFFITKRLTPIDAEVIVYNNKIASMIDCIAQTLDGKYFILDWKTNKKIEKNGYGKRMLPPFSMLPDCNHSHYTLQVNIYKQLYKEYPISGMYVVHLHDTGYDFIKIEDINLNLSNVGMA